MAATQRARELEYKCPEDNAWYHVSLQYGYSRGRVAYFKINYEGVFPEGEQEVVDLNDINKVQDVRRSFRPLSKQLQNSHSRDMVAQGTRVCASYQRGDDLRFYDAVVTQVHLLPHTRTNDGFNCRCTFEVLWKDGPGVETNGRILRNNENRILTVDRICLLTPGSVDDHPGIQFLQSFLDP